VDSTAAHNINSSKEQAEGLYGDGKNLKEEERETQRELIE
jgi:hypothetical protein